MQERKNIIFNHLYYGLFLVLALVIPLWKPIVPYAIGFIVLFWLLQFDFRAKFYRLKKEAFRKYILLFAVFYILHWIGLIYTSNYDSGMFKLEVKLSLFIFPVLISTMPSRVFRSRNVFYIFMMFILGCLIASFIDLGIAADKYQQTKNAGVFYYKYLSFFHHPGYFSMYLTMAVAILIFLLLKREHYFLNSFYQVIFTLLIVYFSIFIILLSSKAGILSLMVVYFITIGYFMVIEKRFLQSILLIILITGLFYISLRVFPYSLDRIITSKEVIESAEEIERDTDEGTGERILIWSSAMEIVRENFLMGVGTGDVEMHLQQKYKEHQISTAFSQHLNAHNQFLQTFIGLGVIGFLVLMFMLVFPAYYALRQQSFLYFIFLIIVSVNLLVESMFETQAGVVFYAFFNAFLFFAINNVKNLELNGQKKRRS